MTCHSHTHTHYLSTKQRDVVIRCNQQKKNRSIYRNIQKLSNSIMKMYFIYSHLYKAKTRKKKKKPTQMLYYVCDIKRKPYIIISSHVVIYATNDVTFLSLTSHKQIKFHKHPYLCNFYIVHIFAIYNRKMHVEKKNPLFPLHTTT